MQPEEMTGSTHILEFMCYANSRFRRDKILEPAVPAVARARRPPPPRWSRRALGRAGAAWLLCAERGGITC